MVSPPIVYAVDDDPHVLGLIRAVARAEKFSLETFESPTDFLRAYQAGRKGCLLLDYRLPEMTGLDVLRELSARRLDLPVILMTSEKDSALPDKARSGGAIDFLAKPFSPVVLMQRIDRALARSGLVR